MCSDSLKLMPRMMPWADDEDPVSTKSTVEALEAAVKLEAHSHQARLTLREARGVVAAARPDP